jgi:hypothetical protein
MGFLIMAKVRESEALRLGFAPVIYIERLSKINQLRMYALENVSYHCEGNTPIIFVIGRLIVFYDLLIY